MEKIAYFGWAASKDPRAKRLQDGVYAIGIGDEEFDSLKPGHMERYDGSAVLEWQHYIRSMG